MSADLLERPTTHNATPDELTEDYRRQHHIARWIQRQNPGFVVWFGEHTKHFFVMDRFGLYEREDPNELGNLLELLRLRSGIAAI